MTPPLTALVEALRKFRRAVDAHYNSTDDFPEWLAEPYLEAGDALAAHRAALSAFEAEPQRSPWRPISEAKKDGTRYLLGKIVGHPDRPTSLWWAVLGHWSERWKNWNDGVEPCGLAGPTHFMEVPLPLPPEMKE